MDFILQLSASFAGQPNFRFAHDPNITERPLWVMSSIRLQILQPTNIAPLAWQARPAVYYRLIADQCARLDHAH